MLVSRNACDTPTTARMFVLIPYSTVHRACFEQTTQQLCKFGNTTPINASGLFCVAHLLHCGSYSRSVLMGQRGQSSLVGLGNSSSREHALVPSQSLHCGSRAPGARGQDSRAIHLPGSCGALTGEALGSPGTLKPSVDSGSSTQPCQRRSASGEEDFSALPVPCPGCPQSAMLLLNVQLCRMTLTTACPLGSSE